MSEPAEAREHYSFSRLTSFHNCPYAWHRRYVLHEEGEGNAFSSYGSLLHSIMERWANGEIPQHQLADTFEWEFAESVPEPFPPNKFADLHALYYKQALSYLRSFRGFPGHRILAAEQQFELPVRDWDFVGIIDLILKDEETGDIRIRDYKSKKEFRSKEEIAQYARQLLLYARYVKERYGVWPTDVGFIHFRRNGLETVIPFREEEAEATLHWAIETVEEIRSCFSFPPHPEPFFCHHLCNYRANCAYKGEATE